MRPESLRRGNRDAPPGTWSEPSAERRGPLFEGLERRALLSTFVVDSALDSIDGDYSDGQFTLREAVQLANANPDADTILFASSLYGRAIQIAGYTITASLEIRGYDSNGSWNNITLRGGSNGGPNFVIDDGDASTLIDVTIDGLGFFGEAFGDHGINYFTGGFQTAENLTIRRSVLTALREGAYAVTFDGSDGGSLTIDSSSISGAHDAVGTTSGGAVRIEASTLTSEGLGVDAEDPSSVAIINSTIAGNWRGGVRISGAAGSALISNCTIANNGADSGSGILMEGGVLTLVSTIVAANGQRSEIKLDGGTLNLEASHHNLVRDAASAGGLVGGERGNLVGVDPQLGSSLRSNGGSTGTLALRAGSPALDAGSNDLALGSDQRGLPFARESGATDIGAYEVQALSLVVSVAEDIDDGDNAPGHLSLREAVGAAGGNPGDDVITFESSMKGATITLQREILIEGSLTLRGLGRDLLTIDGANATRLFRLRGEARISDLTLSRGTSSTGGALYGENTKSLILTRVGLDQSTATGSGGAVSLSSQYINPELTLVDCVFTGNHAGESGGAIYVRSNILSDVRGTEFISNSAVIDGGAAWGARQIQTSVFLQNAAGRDGGAVWSAQDLSDCEFRENTAGSRGGAVWAIDILVTDSILDDNSASEGGAIYASTHAQLLRAALSGNRGSVGGAVRAAIVTATDSQFVANASTGQGGAIFLFGPWGSLSLVGSTLRENTAGTDGGAVYANRPVTISESTFASNSAVRGGAIFNLGSLTISSSTLSANSASGPGGALYNDGVDVGVLTIRASTLQGNVSGSDGGALWTNAAAHIVNSTFASNEAAGFGGAIAIDGGRVTVLHATIVSNAADSDGDGHGAGGGICVGAQSGIGTLRSESSIHAFNTRGSGVRTPDEIALSGGGSLDPNSSYNLVFDAGSAAGMTDALLGNIVGHDPLLGPLAKNGGPTETVALLTGSPAIDAANPTAGQTEDQRGATRPYNGRSDIGAFEWLPTSFFSLSAHDDAVIRPADDADGSLRLLAWNLDGDLIVFRETDSGWEATRPLDKVDAPAAAGNGVIWTDPATGLTSIGGASPEGFIVYTEEADGSWTFRNLSEDLALGDHTPVGGLTQFVSREGLIVIFGIDASGRMGVFHQLASPNGPKPWAFTDISAQLDDQGMATPALTGITSFVTPWDAWNVVGLDASGDIQAIWIHPRTFGQWRVDDLSEITGALPLSGQLTVTQTTWHAINIGGTDASGHVVVTWWLPSFGRDWVTSDLTDAAGAQPFAVGNLTGWVSPWGAINYAGLNARNEVTALWWTPTTGWKPSVLGAADATPERLLTSHQSPDGAMSVLGAQADDDVFQLWWTPESGNVWSLVSVTDVAERV